MKNKKWIKMVHGYYILYYTIINEFYVVLVNIKTMYNALQCEIL